MAQHEVIHDTAVYPYDSEWERTNELRGGRYDIDPESQFKLRRAMRGLALLKAGRAKAAADGVALAGHQADRQRIDAPMLLPNTVKLSELNGNPIYGETDAGDIVVVDHTDLAA